MRGEIHVAIFQKRPAIRLKRTLKGLILSSKGLDRPDSCVILMDKGCEVGLLLPEVLPVGVTSDDYEVGSDYKKWNHHEAGQGQKGIEDKHHHHDHNEEDEIRNKGRGKALRYILQLIAVIDDSCDDSSRGPGIEEA